jgi:hypothetical protein
MPFGVAGKMLTPDAALGIIDMFNMIKRWFTKKPVEQAAPIPPGKTAKELATEKGEAYVNIISMDIDPNGMGMGSFELDWNAKFIADLVRHGYMMDQNDTDSDIVDRWFTNVCRNVVLETYEQYEAMSNRVVKTRDMGDGRSEVS